MVKNTNFEKNLYDTCIYSPEDIKQVIKKSGIKNNTVTKYIKKKKEEIAIDYINAPLCFYIETSSFYDNKEKAATMYCWTLCINGITIIGRTWEEFLNTLGVLKTELQLSDTKRLIIYVHNLAFEFQWIQHKFDFQKVFATDSRKPVYAETKDGFDFRCSYFLSGCALEHIGKFMEHYKVKKAAGDLDYTKIRHTKTPLTKKEYGYVMYEGKTVCGYIQEQIERYGNIIEIPMTKTGVVRRLCRDACLSSVSYRSKIQRLILNPELYDSCKRAFAGGFTHANALHSLEVCKKVSSFDFSSSYPAVICSEKFPMGTPKKIIVRDFETFKMCIRNYCCVFDIRFLNIKKKDNAPDCIISSSRCFTKINPVYDNGRIFSADEIITTITDVDFSCIEHFYDFESIEKMFVAGEKVISNMWVWEKDYLPKELINFVLDLYVKKTKLKGVDDKIIEYTYIKELLNSCYGMMCTDIIRDDITYNGEWDKTPAFNKTAKIDKYNKNKNRFLYYPWGVFVTAYARKNLLKNILAVGNDYIYSDTDSIKIFNREKHQHKIDDYNNEIKEKLTKMSEQYKIELDKTNPLTIKGKEKPLGAFDYEGTYDEFKTLGAKRYLIRENGKLEMTVAGVSKEHGAAYMEKEFAEEAFHAFNDGLVIPAGECGKLVHTYNDTGKAGTVTDYLGNTAEYSEQSFVHLEESSYNLGLEEYMNFIKGSVKVEV